MYGKHFESMYTGSMLGQGALVFAVWGYVISHFYDDVMELNPALLATMIGEPEAEIEAVIKRLCQPDPKSRSKEEEGRRLVKIGQFAYRVVNGPKYRAMRDPNERREYMKQYMREYRNDKGENEDSVNSVNSVNNCKPELTQLAHTETETETDTETKDSCSNEQQFERFWCAYPRKVGKRRAQTLWNRLKPSAQLCAIIFTKLEEMKTSEQWMKDNGQFIPYPGTWLNRDGWYDELPHEETSEETVARLTAKGLLDDED